MDRSEGRWGGPRVDRLVDPRVDRSEDLRVDRSEGRWGDLLVDHSEDRSGDPRVNRLGVHSEGHSGDPRVNCLEAHSEGQMATPWQEWREGLVASKRQQGVVLVPAQARTRKPSMPMGGGRARGPMIGPGEPAWA